MESKICKVVSLFVFAACVAACARGAEYTALSPVDRPARSADQVEIFMDTKPSKPYKTVADIRTTGGSAMSTSGDSIVAIRKVAAAHGLDGVIITCAAPGTISGPVGDNHCKGIGILFGE